MRKNKIVSVPFLHQIFKFLSYILKKQVHLPCVLEKTSVSRYIPLPGKQKYQVTKLAQRAKLLITFVQGIIEFAMNENDRKTSE